MRLGALEKVRHKVTLGKALPFGIRDAGGRLLLARGQVLADEEQLSLLLDRGAFVDLDEVNGPRAEILQAPPERLPALWRAFAERVMALLRGAPAGPGAPWVAAVEEAARTGLTLVDRLPDLAIFMIVRGDAPPSVHYGVMHCVHTAATLALMGRRLGWADARTLQLMRAALTMNLSIIDLQGRLSGQMQPPNANQRQAIRDHPLRSVALLEAAGVTDDGWLAAVAQHHEVRGGAGYPRGVPEVDEGADALRVADRYTAKLSARASRPALAPNLAAKQLFTAEGGSKHGAVVVKEFGIYPPGSFVTLQSGETAVVVRRGANANTPTVASLVGRGGEPLMQPVSRDTSMRAHTIVSAVPDNRVPVRVAPETLYAERLH